MQAFLEFLGAVNAIMLSMPVLLALLGCGILFTFWSGFSQYRALTHGVALVTGKGIKTGKSDGVLTHFQALSAALSATVGLGNIGGVAIAVSLGGPGAVFWMWVVGFAGMALKTAEVTMAMLYRNTDDPDNPHGGTMWAAKKGLAELGPKWAKLGAVMAMLFTIPLILFGLTGGNMFQAWNASEIAREYFGVPTIVTGGVLAVVVGLVILGGIQRIGKIAGTLVPLMCGLYVICGIAVLIANAEQIPDMFRLIFTSAFSEAEATGAFTGAAFGTAFIFGMKRALFSSEAGLGSAPIAHSAVKTPEPVTEGVVAGLEPFIDTIVVCTITALVILSSGVWKRDAVADFYAQPAFVQVNAGEYQPATDLLPQRKDDETWRPGDQVFVVAKNPDGERSRVYGTVQGENGIGQTVAWRAEAYPTPPTLAEHGIFADYPAATLTARAFDSAWDGLGRWMVTIAVFLFAISTMITWSYYAEQGVVYLLGQKWVMPYRISWCALIFVTCLGFIRTDAELDTVSTVALGFMLAINLPTMLLLGSRIMGAWHDYFARLKEGEIARRGE